MTEWWMTAEPSLDDLLADEIMTRVLRADGLDKSEFRRRLVELARRLSARSPLRSCCGAAVG